MKKPLLLLFYSQLSILNCQLTNAQAPDKISYQAVVRNTNGNIVSSTGIGLRISILQGSQSGTVVYSETHSKNTNANGLFNVIIGDGNVTTGNIGTIIWADGPYFLKSETDPNGGTNYVFSSTVQWMSVPYALHAKTAENGDKVVTLANGQNISVAGVYPNFTINNIAPLATSYVGVNGISIAGTNIINTNPDKILTIVGAGAVTVTNNYPNITINSPLSPVDPWTVAGSNLYYDKGNVGIGTTNPLSVLHIQTGTTSGTGRGGILVSGFNSRLSLGDGFTGTNPLSNPVWCIDNSNDVLRIFRQSNLTVGGFVPFSLNTQGGVNLLGGLTIDYSNANNGTATVNGIRFGPGSLEGIASKRTPGGNNAGLDFYTGGVNRMAITNAGNVGIGTTNPSSPFEVAGVTSNVAIQITNNALGNSGIELRSGSSSAFQYID